MDGITKRESSTGSVLNEVCGDDGACNGGGGEVGALLRFGSEIFIMFVRFGSVVM